MMKNSRASGVEEYHTCRLKGLGPKKDEFFEEFVKAMENGGFKLKEHLKWEITFASEKSDEIRLTAEVTNKDLTCSYSCSLGMLKQKAGRTIAFLLSFLALGFITFILAFQFQGIMRFLLSITGAFFIAIVFPSLNYAYGTRIKKTERLMRKKIDSFIVEIVKSMIVQKCQNHPEFLTSGFCSDCGKSYCDRCLHILEVENINYVCPECLETRHHHKHVIRPLYAGITFILLGFILLLFSISRPASDLIKELLGFPATPIIGIFFLLLSIPFIAYSIHSRTHPWRKPTIYEREKQPR